MTASAHCLFVVASCRRQHGAGRTIGDGDGELADELISVVLNREPEPAGELPQPESRPRDVDGTDET